MNVSFSFLSVPFKAVGVLPFSMDPYKKESNRMNYGFRLSEMKNVNDNVTLGVESGLMIGSELKVYSDRDNPTDTYWETEVYLDKTFILPILAKAGYSFTSSDNLQAGLNLGIGFYAYDLRLRFVDKYYINGVLDSKDENKSDLFKIKPAFELGFNAGYKLAENLRINAGLNLGLTKKIEIVESIEPAEFVEFGGFSWGGNLGIAYLF